MPDEKKILEDELDEIEALISGRRKPPPGLEALPPIPTDEPETTTTPPDETPTAPIDE